MKKALPDVTETQAMIMGFTEARNRVKVNFDLENTNLEGETDSLLCDIKDAHPNVTPAEELAAVAILKRGYLIIPLIGVVF